MMKHRGWIRLLSIVTALLLPVSAMAQSAAMGLLEQADTDGKEIVSTVTFEPGKTIKEDQIVADISAALALRFHKLPGGYGAFAISMSDTDVLSALLRVDSDGIYAQSEILGDKPLYIAWEDMEKGLTELMKTSGMDDKMLSSFTQGLEQGLSSGVVIANAETTDMSKEEVNQKILELMGGDEDMAAWIQSIENKKVVTNGEFTLGGSDVADTKTELTITKEDMAALYQTQYVKNQLTTQLTAQDSSLSADEAAAKTEEMIAEILTELDKSDFSMPITVLTMGEDDLVAMQYNMTGTFTVGTWTTTEETLPTVSEDDSATDEAVQTADEEATDTDAAAQPVTKEETAKIDISMLFARKTLDDGGLYTLSVAATKDDEKALSVNASLTKGSTATAGNLTITKGDGTPIAELTLAADYKDPAKVSGTLQGTATDGENQYAFVLAADQTVSDTTIDTAISLSTGDTLDAIKADPDKAMLGTLKVKTVVQDDSGFFASIASATPENSVEIMKLSDDEMTAYTQSLETTSTTVLLNIYSLLPQSVADLLSTQMSQ